VSIQQNDVLMLVEIKTEKYSVSQKNPPPLKLCDIFSQTVGNFSPNFTRLLHIPIDARLQIFIQLPATLTKLCHMILSATTTIDRSARWVVALNMA